MGLYAPLICLPLAGLLAWATAADVRSRRIPNSATFAMVVTGLAAAISGQGLVGVGGALGGMLLGFGLGLSLHVAGMLGGGDVKLLAGVGAWLGPWNAAGVFVLTAVLAMALTLAQCAWRGRLKALLANTWMVLDGLLGFRWLRGGDGPELRPVFRSIDKPLPYALPVALATGVAIAALAARGGGG